MEQREVSQPWITTLGGFPKDGASVPGFGGYVEHLQE